MPYCSSSSANDEEPKTWRDIPFKEINLMKDKYFVDYNTSEDCLIGCKMIMDNMGFEGEYGGPDKVIYLARENETHTKLENYGDDVEGNYENAVNCINGHLEDGRPVIVGSGYDEDKEENYYIYVETGTNHLSKGNNAEDNRFYYYEGT